MKCPRCQQENPARLELLSRVRGLARCLDRQGRRAEARGALAEVYGWFTEGFETADLREGRTLLDELSTA